MSGKVTSSNQLTYATTAGIFTTYWIAVILSVVTFGFQKLHYLFFMKTDFEKVSKGEEASKNNEDPIPDSIEITKDI